MSHVTVCCLAFVLSFGSCLGRRRAADVNWLRLRRRKPASADLPAAEPPIVEIDLEGCDAYRTALLDNGLSTVGLDGLRQEASEKTLEQTVDGLQKCFPYKFDQFQARTHPVRLARA